MMGQESAGDAAGASSDAGRLLNADVNIFPHTARGHALAGGEQNTTTLYGVSTLLSRGTGTWSYRKRNALQACILLMALTGAVLGTQYLVTKIRYLSGAEHHSSELVLQAETQQFVSHATTYRLPQIFQVGGPGATWKVPATPDAFTSWAANISFRQGDVLRFTGGIAGEYILQVSDAAYAACITSAVFWWRFGLGQDVYIQLVQIVTYNFIKDTAVQCLQGMKLSTTVNLMAVPAAPVRPNVNAPNRQPGVFQVGGQTATWAIPSSPTFYEDWASNISFLIGDVLSFTFTDSNLQVVEVPYSSYEMCTSLNYVWYAAGTATYQLTNAGIQYFLASTPGDCIQGMKFTVNVYEPGSTDTVGGLGSPASSPGGSPLTTTPSGSTPSGSTPSGSTPQSPSSGQPKTATEAIVGGVLGTLFGVAGLAAAGGLAYKFALCRNCSFYFNFCPNFNYCFNFHHHTDLPEGNQKPGEDDLKFKSKG